MLRRRRGGNGRGGPLKDEALVFAALGDETRLALVGKLCGGESQSISQLTELIAGRAKGSRLTRQAITKHLRVLEKVGIVRCVSAGRESMFEFNPAPVREMKEYLDFVSAMWEEALGRLKVLVEKA